ncbi:peroxisomal membrane anchor protein conserved region-domain-containing protein [Vararia minispora EC-137]|uniref:Peroxisomal membrane anchor protein conserved region-domain-containing protein n=1 Tax=Vararia minispora EC-137 TaxID=1314806 RepID=A0ACB8QGC7_9AGAM|nr:peroxisomal membrane anchor protein conserved region-domain-containing protein [Vararia minispora EC-137]
MDSERQDAVRNAVAFLNDPKTQNAPLAQRVQFLQAKGLTPAEIDAAIRQSAPNSSSGPQYAGPIYPAAYGSPQPSPWDWRDYFITAVVSGTIGYGVIALARKYLLPHLLPPSATVYEQDRDTLTAQFDAAEALLKEIQADTAAVKAAVEDQKERVDKVITDVDAAVGEMREREQKARDELREIRDEINNIRDMLPKMIEKSKESQTQSLSELQQELKSLKALLLSRGPTTSGYSTPPPPQIPQRASIPAWQLAGTPSAQPLPTSTASRAASPASIPGTPFAPLPSVGKGKETAVPGPEQAEQSS